MIPYTMSEVLKLNSIDFKPNQTSIRVLCPFCSKKKINKDLGISLDSEKFNCFCCGISGRGATEFHAYLHNITTKEAYAEIMQQLGYSTDKANNMPKRERTVTHIEPPLPQSEEADDITKNQTYSMLLSCLKLSDRHTQDLLERGFLNHEIATLGYVTYPKSKSDGYTEEYFSIPKRLIGQNCTLKGIPGFHKTKNKNVWTLCRRKGGILVPYRNFYNQITGIQLRKNNEDLLINDETGEAESKYTWLSSNNLKEGCKTSSKIHFATDFEWSKEKQEFHPVLKKGIIVLTEGAMKADLTHMISGLPFMAVPGVSCASEALKVNIPLLKEIGLEKVIIAYDMDKVMNINVSEALVKMKKLIEEFGIIVEELYWSTDMVLTDGTHEKMDVSDTFVFTTSSLADTLEADKLDKMLSKIKGIDKKQIIFALANSKELTEENKCNYSVLKKACEKEDLICRPAFWSLKLKGIDDYYACKQRNVNYQFAK